MNNAPEQKIQPVDTTRHENTTGIDPDDIGILAAFTRRVSAELHTIDGQNVGSNSNIKAMQLDQKKILDGVDINKKHKQSGKQTLSSTQLENTLKAPVGDNQPPVSVATATQHVEHSSVLHDSTLLDRIESIERKLKVYTKSKRIKRNVSYTVSSNSFKGVIKDAELLAEYVMSEVAKGVKTITIKINENKHTQ